MEPFCSAMDLDGRSKREAGLLNPLKLAFLGDAVYEIYVRTYIMKHFVMTPHEMSKKAISYVKASEQAYAVKAMMAQLTEEEVRMVKRGRNQKSGSVPKNAQMSDYRYATGFEALLGYLFMSGDSKRAEALSLLAIELIDGKGEADEEKVDD
ncbi:Mini-ribonuclease 3 [Fusibacter sp. JL298sf-3]